MKRFFTLTGLLFICFFSFAQTGNKIILGTIDSIDSKILHEQRKVWVYVPNSTDGGIYSKQHYPVVYLLDGDAHFYSVVGMIQQLSSVNGNTICPEMIVVGIPNTDRTRDLTPTHVVADPPYMDSNFSKNSGGGEQFTAFIEKELMPYIDSTYPTQPYRMLIGHSFGGLLVMNTLMHHPNLFNSYVAIDPSMWWEKQQFLSQTKAAFEKQTFAGKTLFLAIANTMDAGMDTLGIQKDTASQSRHIRSILALNKYASLNKQDQLKFKSKYYDEDNHGSVPLIAEYDALHFIFSYYPLKLSLNDYTKMDKQVIAKIEKHYEDISKEFGYKVPVPESMTNNMGYQALNTKNYEVAEYLFRMNTIKYPGSYNVFDSFGDYYNAKNEKIKAIENYKKALAIKEVADTRKKLEKLEGK